MPRRNSGARLRFLEKRGCYYIVWTERGRSRERSTGTAHRERAEIALAEFINLRARDSGPRDPAAILITDVLADYAQEHGAETAAPWRIAAAIKGLVPFWQGLTVADVTRETCRAFAKSRGRSAGTVRRELGVLRAAINHEHKSGRLTRVVAVHLPDRPEPRDRWLTRAEVARLVAGALGFTFAKCSDLHSREQKWVVCDREAALARLHLPLFVLLGVYTGARKEAILSLRWSQVDVNAGRIDYQVPGARRTNKRRARIPIPAKLLGHLRRAKLRGTQIGFVVHDNGRRLADVKRGFSSACRRAGLDDVTPHVLRHTCATWLMQRGVPMWEAAGFLGMSLETLERVYGHHSPDYLKSAAEAFA
jgi:integrase